MKLSDFNEAQQTLQRKKIIYDMIKHLDSQTGPFVYQTGLLANGVTLVMDIEILKKLLLDEQQKCFNKLLELGIEL